MTFFHRLPVALCEALNRPRRGSVSGFKTDIDNEDWIIAKAEHTIDENGFTTHLELELKIPEWIAEKE
ncbi:hypothetical protein R991_004380 [Salmonella enterica]|nr:hypothetical protein [Salmonella enterica]